MACLFCFFSVSIEDEEDKEFDEKISKYPSSFDLQIDCLPKPRLQTVLEAQIGKLDNGFVLLDEEIQVNNLISYLSFKLGNIDQALHYNSKALMKERRNGIALANRARYNKYLMNLFDAEKDLVKLESLYTNDNVSSTTKLLAEGELAQSYARFGAKFHEAAILKYESLFRNCSQIRTDVVILWKYDCCLCLRRTLHIFNKMEYPDRDPVETLRKACKMLVEIIDSSAHLPAYRARAWAELGQMVYQIEKNPDSLGYSLLECIPIQKRYISSESYFDKALEIGLEDFDTIEVCAKHMRYFDKPEKALELFERALKFRETSLVYHHMALCLKKIEHMKANQHRNQGQSNYRGQPRYRRSQRNRIQTTRAREQSNLKRSLKCGRYAMMLPWNHQTKRMLDLFEMAHEKDQFNHFAVYEKAFLLRQLKRTEEAKTEFCKLLNSLEIGELKISCYEQAGYCCLDLLETDTQDTEKYRFDGIHYLRKAIEVAVVVATKVKYESMEVRSLIPTAKTMLLEPGLWETNNNQLQRLQDLLLKHGKLLPLVKEASSDKTCDISTLLERCLSEDQNDDAVLLTLLDVLASEQDDSKFSGHLTTILKSASKYLTVGDKDSAKTSYQIFYRMMGLRRYEENREYDAFLMTDDDSEHLRSMYQIAGWLKDYCGLNVVNSDEHCAYGRQILHDLTNFSLESVAVFLVLKNSKLNHIVEMVVTSILSMPPESPERKPKLVILKDEPVELPAGWANVPTITLPKEQGTFTASDISSWLLNLFNVVQIN